MIEGSLSDVSLSGLLQFLATESNRSYKVKIVSGQQRAELFICEGELLAANYGILEGNDALTEMLFWQEGTFNVERLASRFKSTIATNLKIDFRQINTFADQMLFLQEEAVGLNTEIVPSPRFGTQEWQEALARQPLSKDDFAVIGWITDGRTMRQAMREFNLDVLRATSALFRLLITGSVETLRPNLGGIAELDDMSIFSDTAGSAEPEDKVNLEKDAEISKAEPKPDAKGESKVRTRGKAEVNEKVEKSQKLEQQVQAVEEEPKAPETITSDDLPAVGSPAFEALMNKAKAAAPVPAASNTEEQKSSVATEVKATEIKEPEPEKRNFDIRRTDPLPLVAIDIERLFQTNFHVSPYGHLALGNDALDEELRAVLADFKAGKTFISVASEKGRVHAQVLHTCKYSLERGYLDPPDAVASLTADLLLGRVEIEQYLLQRRRMTGDELRDLNDLSKQKGVKLVELLVKTGFMTQSDWDRLVEEKDRFSPH